MKKSMTDKMDPPHPPTSPTARRKLNSQTADQKSESEQEGLQLDKWCIYRVPSKLRKVNEAAYTPQLLSIGPFHHGKPELKDMEERKKDYYEKFRKHCSKGDPKLFFKDIKARILDCYAGTIDQLESLEKKIDPIELESLDKKIDPIELESLDKKIDPLDIIVVDACFIIELFLMNSDPKECKNDYILRSPWLRKAVEQDLILFENQVPYSLLKELYAKRGEKQAQAHPKEIDNDKAEAVQDPDPCFQHCFPCFCTIDIDKDKAEAVQDHDPFLKLTCDFFKDYSKGKSVKNGLKPKHFTDLVRHFLCPQEEERKMELKDKLDKSTNTPIKNIYVVKQLRAAGVKFRPLNNEDHAASPCFAKKTKKDQYAGFFIKVDDDHKLTLACFRNIYLRLTQFCVKDETECIMRNVMALEQFLYPDEPYVCNYFLLMDELVDTVEDVNFLVESQVIINMLGSNKAVAKLINSLCENIMEDKSYYVDVCEQLNKHYQNFWNRHVATLRQVYFKDLWTGSATILGFVVLVVSLTVSIRTIISGRKLCIKK